MAKSSASEAAAMPGGWTSWNFKLTPAATAAFKEATAGLVGVKYSNPVAFASQLVNGTNYAFLCEATSATLPSSTYPVVLHAYQPIGGKAVITGIQKVGPFPYPAPGGWQNWNFKLTPEATKVFNAAMKGFVGVKYSPAAFTTQIVNGTNYCYLCQGAIVVPGAPQTASLVYIHQPLPGQGDAHVTGIKPVATH